MAYHPKVIQYADLLKKFNKSINLISRKDMDRLFERHIDDGVLSHHAYLNNTRVSSEYPIYDLGSGNGVPGFIWAILCPDKTFYLVDTDERKCEFLKTAANRLDMANLKVINSSFYELKPEPKAEYLCRGLMSISDFFKDDNPFYFLEGYFIKGSTWNIEAKDIIKKTFQPYEYPLNDGTPRFLVHCKSE